ncbi:MAG TPA: HEAT repeat domain-containing protein [Pyrinomonadaceae bacterium]
MRRRTAESRQLQEVSYRTANPALTDAAVFRRAAESRQLRKNQSTNPGDGAALSDEAVLRRAAVDLAQRKADRRAAALSELARNGGHESFDRISKALSDCSPTVRSAAVRALYEINPELAASFLNRALGDGSLEERKRIGLALAETGSTTDQNNDPSQQDPREVYGEFSRLFLLAKAGQVQSLISVIEEHPNTQLRLAVIKLLSLREEADVVTAFYHLAMRASLSPKIRSAVMEALFKINLKNRRS